MKHNVFVVVDDENLFHRLMDQNRLTFVTKSFGKWYFVYDEKYCFSDDDSGHFHYSDCLCI